VTDVRSLAAPSLVVRNNESATITVGVQIPVNSTSVNTGGNADNVITSAQYVSTGVTLDVTPRINPGGLVYLDISQEVSQPGQPAQPGDNPPISDRRVQSQVAVQSGQTVFLGGLIQESDTRGRGGVPYLSRIPGVGALFGSQSKRLNRTETIVMITPTVLENNADLEAVTEDLEDEFIQVTPLKISTLHSSDNDDETDDE
jgi:general secretion pathway protein D